MMLCNEPGFEKIACPDGRRGVWIRLIKDDTDQIVRIEFAAGREGDDLQFSLCLGETLTHKQLYNIYDALSWLPWSQELADDNKRNRTLLGRLRLLWYKARRLVVALSRKWRRRC